MKQHRADEEHNPFVEKVLTVKDIASIMLEAGKVCVAESIEAINRKLEK